MSPILKRISQLTVVVIVQGICLFGGAGTLRWAAGWWYLGLYVLLIGVGALTLFPSHTDVVEERSRGAKGAKNWDTWITRLFGIPTLGALILAGLDERFQWTAPLPLWARLIGGLAFVGGYALVLWAMYCNPFFSQVVRIQTERGHTAVTGGPYRIIRHPGYLGMTVSMLGVPFLLDSVWVFLCLILYVVLVVTRTMLEDRTLQAELPGYIEYAAHTKFRLLPGIW